VGILLQIVDVGPRSTCVCDLIKPNEIDIHRVPNRLSKRFVMLSFGPNHGSMGESSVPIVVGRSVPLSQ